MNALSAEELLRFEPFNRLQENRAVELASHCSVEEVDAGDDPLSGDPGGQAIYLLEGELELTHADGRKRVLRAGGLEAASPLPAVGAGSEVRTVRALTPVRLTRIDKNLLDIMLTWDQMTSENPGAGGEGDDAVAHSYEDSGWNLLTGVFSVQNLTTGTFAAMPAAHISRMLQCFETVPVTRGQVVIREGDAGDYYYVISTGRAQVTRIIGGVSMPLADFKSGAAFGEEALILDTKRNATITMITNGSLLRLAKSDFIEMLKVPLLAELELAEAEQRIAAGAVWVDVRFPSEYQYDRLAGAINIPLGELRHAFSGLDNGVEYIVYCQSGRRSSAAAFLLAQRGFRASVLAGGLWKARGSD